MRFRLRGLQFLSHFSSLLNEILFAGFVALEICLKAILGIPHAGDLVRLSLQLPAEFCECLVTLSDLRASKFAFVGSIAELLFKRCSALRCSWSLKGRVWRRGLGNIGAMAHTDPVRGQAQRNKWEDAGCLEHPYMSTG